MGGGVSLRRSFMVRRVFSDGAGLVAILALGLPVLLTDRAYFGDWGNHLFLLDQQSRWLQSHFEPTYFLHTTETGAFYPHFMFYGGTLYWVVGQAATVVGAAAAYKLATVAAMATAYFATLWMARQLRITGIVAHFPAVLALSGAYYLSKLYLDGGWPEFVALSMIPLAVASAAALLRDVANRVTSGAALVGSLVLLTGSHMITALYGLIFLLAVAVALGVAGGRSVRLVRRQVGLVVALGLLAVGVNAWFLMPAARYAELTIIGGSSLFDSFDRLTAPFNDWRVMFHPGRVLPDLMGIQESPFYVQEPLFVLIWLVIVGLVVAPLASALPRRLFRGLAGLLAGYFGLMWWRAPWDHAPEILLSIQFRLRLHAYVGLCIVGLTLLGLVIVARATQPRIWGVALGVACAAAFTTATWQAWSAPKFLRISDIIGRADTLPPIDYANCPAPCQFVNTDYRIRGPVGGTKPHPIGPVDLTEARRGGLALTVPGGTVTVLNVAWSPLLAIQAGEATAGPSSDGLVAIDATDEPADETIPVRIATQQTFPTRTGVAISLGCLVGLTLILALPSVRRRCRRGRNKPRSATLASYRPI